MLLLSYRDTPCWILHVASFHSLGFRSSAHCEGRGCENVHCEGRVVVRRCIHKQETGDVEEIQSRRLDGRFSTDLGASWTETRLSEPPGPHRYKHVTPYNP